MEVVQMDSQSTGLTVAFATFPTHIRTITSVCAHMACQFNRLSEGSLAVLTLVHLSWREDKVNWVYFKGAFIFRFQSLSGGSKNIAFIFVFSPPTLRMLLFGVVRESSSHTEAHGAVLAVVWFLSCVQSHVIFQ